MSHNLSYIFSYNFVRNLTYNLAYSLTTCLTTFHSSVLISFLETYATLLSTWLTALQLVLQLFIQPFSYVFLNQCNFTVNLYNLAHSFSHNLTQNFTHNFPHENSNHTLRRNLSYDSSHGQGEYGYPTVLRAFLVYRVHIRYIIVPTVSGPVFLVPQFLFSSLPSRRGIPVMNSISARVRVRRTRIGLTAPSRRTRVGERTRTRRYTSLFGLNNGFSVCDSVRTSSESAGQTDCRHVHARGVSSRIRIGRDGA